MTRSVPAREHFHPLRIAEVRQETDRAVVVAFDVPDELRDTFRFVHGQYLTLRTSVGEETIERCYSICSGVDDDDLRVAIKRVEGGLFSNYANESLRAGSVLDVLPPKGSFHTPLERGNEKHYMCICAGSGITPILSIVKSVLSREPGSFVTLLFGNRSSATVMFRDELTYLKNRYMTRLSWISILSREQQDADVLNGRLNNRKGSELQRKGLIDVTAADEFFLCGPQSMISEVSMGLRRSGARDANIHYELFFASPEDSEKVIGKHRARAHQYSGQVCDVTVTVAGRSSRFELSPDGENILDAALNNGADLPFSCKNGVCATCKARLVKGDIEMDINHALTEREIAEGFILTCQAHPISETIAIDFDQL